jgi:hypothetical protein
MQAPVSGMQIERSRNAVAGLSLPRGRGSGRVGPRLSAFDDGMVVLCCLALIALLVVTALLGLFYWVVRALPASLIMACPQVDGCVAPERGDNQAVGFDELPLNGPQMVP